MISPEELLRSHNLSVTAQRLAVLKVVQREPHSTADDIYNNVSAEIGAISRQSVFDTVNNFSERGLLRRIQPMGSSARYETRIEDNHHHLICRSCACLVDIDCVTGVRPCLTAADNVQHGFVIDEAEVIFWGYCPSCQTQQPPTESISKKGQK